MKIIKDHICYVSKHDLERISIPFLKDGIMRVKYHDSFGEFINKEAINYFKKREDIIDYKFLASLSEESLIDEVNTAKQNLHPYVVKLLEASKFDKKVLNKNEEFQNKINALQNIYDELVNYKNNKEKIDKKMFLYNLLSEDKVVQAINKNMDNLLELIPEIKDMIGFLQKHPHHHLDVFEHTLYALSLSDNDFTIRLVLLLHDIGKPHTFVEGEVRHYPNHALEGSNIAKDILNRFDFSNEFIDEVTRLIKLHDTPISEEDINNNYDFAYKQYKVQYCDALAHDPNHLEKRKEYLIRTRRKFDNSSKYGK